MAEDDENTVPMWKRIFEKRLDAFIAYLLSAFGVFLLGKIPGFGSFLNKSYAIALWVWIVIILTFIAATVLVVLFYSARRAKAAEKKAAARVKELEAEDGKKIALLQDELKRLEKIAKTDELTRLYNRRELRERLHRELQTAHKAKEPISMVIIDIDNFKQVNDSTDHVVGDRVLQEFADLIRDGVRGNDPAFRYEGGQTDPTFRWGGDEFLLLGLNNTPNQARIFAERLRKSVADFHFSGLKNDYPITISAGIAQFMLPDEALKDDALDPIIGECEHKALWALKEAKKTKNRTNVFEPWMKPAA